MENSIQEMEARQMKTRASDVTISNRSGSVGDVLVCGFRHINSGYFDVGGHEQMTSGWVHVDDYRQRFVDGAPEAAQLAAAIEKYAARVARLRKRYERDAAEAQCGWDDLSTER